MSVDVPKMAFEETPKEEPTGSSFFMPEYDEEGHSVYRVTLQDTTLAVAAVKKIVNGYKHEEIDFKIDVIPVLALKVRLPKRD